MILLLTFLAVSWAFTSVTAQTVLDSGTTSLSSSASSSDEPVRRDLQYFDQVSLSAEGATSLEKLASKLADEYESETEKIKFTYTATDSKQGADNLIAGATTVAFSDSPFNFFDEFLTSIKVGAGKAITIPIGVTGLAIVSSVAGLKLTPEVLGGIFSGAISNWSHPDIRALNPSTPEGKINVYVREASGGAQVLSSYLYRNSATWRKSKLGVSKAISWPVGFDTSSESSDDVADTVQKRANSIGFCAYMDAVKQKANMVSLYSPTQESIMYVAPSETTFTNALTSAAITEYPAGGDDWTAVLDSHIDLTKAPVVASDSYPLTHFVFATIPEDLSHVVDYPGEASSVLGFVWYATHSGQDLLFDDTTSSKNDDKFVGIIPIPAAAKLSAEDSIRRVKFAGIPLVGFI